MLRLLTNESANFQLPTISDHANRSQLTGGHHFRATRAPTVDNFFVGMTKDRGTTN